MDQLLFEHKKNTAHFIRIKRMELENSGKNVMTPNSKMTVNQKFMIIICTGFCVLTIGVIIALNWQFSIKSDFGTFKGNKFDRVRGVITDFLVGMIAISCAALAITFAKVEIAEIGMLVFMFQEATNFLCDNALRTVHLRFHYEAETQIPQTISILHTDNTQIWTVNTPHEYCRARHQMIEDNTVLIGYDADSFDIGLERKWKLIKTPTDIVVEDDGSLKNVFDASGDSFWIDKDGARFLKEKLEITYNISRDTCVKSNGSYYQPVPLKIQVTHNHTKIIEYIYDNPNAIKNIDGSSVRCETWRIMAGAKGTVIERAKNLTYENIFDRKLAFVSVIILPQNVEVHTLLPVSLLEFEYQDLRRLTTVESGAKRYKVIKSNPGVKTRIIHVAPCESSDKNDTVCKTKSHDDHNCSSSLIRLRNLPVDYTEENIEIIDGTDRDVLSLSAQINMDPDGTIWKWSKHISQKPSDGKELKCEELSQKLKSGQTCFSTSEIEVLQKKCPEWPKQLTYKTFIAVEDEESGKIKYYYPYLGKVSRVSPSQLDKSNVLKFYISNESMGDSSFSTLKYVNQPDIVIKSAAVSLMTLFLLSTIEKAINGVIVKDSKNKYLPLLGLLVANILGSTPINMVRFGWAYTSDERVEGEKLSTNFVILLFLLLSAFYIGVPSKCDPFPNSAKIFMVLSGLCLLVIFDIVNGILADFKQECPRTVLFSNNAENKNDTDRVKAKKRMAKVVQQICIAIMLATYILPIFIQFYLIYRRKQTKMPLCAESVPLKVTAVKVN